MIVSTSSSKLCWTNCKMFCVPVYADSPWNVDAYKMRFDSSRWYSAGSPIPKPVMGKSYLLMCETRGSPKPVPRVRWYRDGKEVRNNRHFYIIVSLGCCQRLLYNFTVHFCGKNVTHVQNGLTG